MEKILVALDPRNPNKTATEFACYLGRLTKSKVTGVFVENDVEDVGFVQNTDDPNEFGEWKVDESTVVYKQKKEAIEQNIRWFLRKCEGEETRGYVHRDHGVPVEELMFESRFADVLVVDPEMSFAGKPEPAPTAFVKEIMKRAECPVIVAPGSFEGIDEVVFAYDNTASSVYAIRQFTYLFPQFRDKKVSVIHVNETGEWAGRDRSALLELLGAHYTNLHFAAHAGDAETIFFDHLLLKKNTFLVIGAYGRSTLSRLLKRSRAELLIKVVTLPIFVAHR